VPSDVSARLRHVRAVVELLRPFNAQAVLLTVGVGYLAAGGPATPTALIAGLVMAALLHSAVTLENDIQDFAVDHANHRQGALQDHSLGRREARLIVWGLLGAAVVVALMAPGRPVHLIYAAVYLAFAWLYNNAPARLSRRPIASMVVMGLCYGALPLLYGYALSGAALGPAAALLAVIWFFQRVSLSILKDFKDAAGDRIHDKRTFYLRFGRRTVVWASVSGAVLAYVATVGLLVVAVPRASATATVLALLALILALRNLLLRGKLLFASDEGHLNRIFHQSLVAHNQFEAVIILCLLFSGK
jgi:4-hydroxybenzoate polyprenyltransferase